MLKSAFDSATTYFHLPFDEQEDNEIENYNRKYITWVANASTTSISGPPISSSPGASSISTPSKSDRGPVNADRDVVQTVLALDDLYAILDLQKSKFFDKLSLRRAYLCRSRACHPDKYPNNPDATHAFQKVAVAYDILSDPALKSSYDTRSRQVPYDAFAARSMGQAEETFRGVVLGVFKDFLEGDLEVIRTLLKAMNDINPRIKLGEDSINYMLVSLESIRDRALTCRTCIHALHAEMTRLLEVQHAFRQLSLWDVFGRTRTAIQLTRITLSLPLALERALKEQQVMLKEMRSDVTRSSSGSCMPQDAEVQKEKEQAEETLLPRHLTLLVKSVDAALEKVEKILK